MQYKIESTSCDIDMSQLVDFYDLEKFFFAKKYFIQTFLSMQFASRACDTA